MIIKNNFNDRNAEPLNNYSSVGKGSASLDRRFEKEKEGFVTKNLNNGVIQDIVDSDHEYQEDDNISEDKWSFFR